jgi:RimJ/RimL family protein N-acetyltransferase
MAYNKTTLEGNHVRLEPLAVKHRDGLCRAIKEGQLWQLHFTFIPHPNDIDGFYQRAENDQNSGSSLVFATIDKRTGNVAGSTRFMRTEWKHKRLEIGFTFLGQSWQKTAINTEAKYLMLCHAFEQLNMNRVELLTDVLNEKSRRAILRIGATEEGTLHNHMVMPDGRVRDSIVFSIIRQDWPDVKQALLKMMTKYDNI